MCGVLAARIPAEGVTMADLRVNPLFPGGVMMTGIQYATANLREWHQTEVDVRLLAASIPAEGGVGTDLRVCPSRL
jgi:hypothetical protein